mgnify:CR=1 FL=1
MPHVPSPWRAVSPWLGAPLQSATPPALRVYPRMPQDAPGDLVPRSVYGPERGCGTDLPRLLGRADLLGVGHP